jgi:hypothetical protein
MLFRFHTSFFHEKGRLLAEIKDANKTLYNFLQKSVNTQNARLTVPSKATSGTNCMISIIESQEHARLILNSLQQNWACSISCAGRHPCSISVHGDNIKAFLSSGGKRKHIRFELRGPREPRRRMKPPSDSLSAIEHQEVTVLSQQVAKKREIQRSKTEPPRSIWSLAEWTLAALSRPFYPDAVVEPDGLERATEKLKKR